MINRPTPTQVMIMELTSPQRQKEDPKAKAAGQRVGSGTLSG